MKELVSTSNEVESHGSHCQLGATNDNNISQIIERMRGSRQLFDINLTSASRKGIQSLSHPFAPPSDSVGFQQDARSLEF
mmetsp:Transcript_11858/g.13188  ORF Transcript_11858/g.13188 Transcript_11858/m.13188 type:complete len:80 (-) Transcript_11858:25-264(-)